jgi:predicted PurR-regulated permease PerM
VTEERVVDFRPSTIFRVLLIVFAVAVVVEVIWLARSVVAWLVVALFLALALNPLVNWLQRRSKLKRGMSIALAYLIVFVVIAALAATFLPRLIDEVNGFVQALPDYVDQVTHGRGRLGFLETKYEIVEKVRKAVQEGGASKVLGLSGAALSVTKCVLSVIAAAVTIIFLTFFMLLEGRTWMDRIYSLLPERSQARWRRVGDEIYETVGGYVTGNILISLIAGGSITIVLLILGVPYAVALGLIFFIVYQQVENHFLQPVIYGRTVQLSPLAVIVSVLVGAELAGILGALAAIPVAGAIQVIVRDLLAHRAGAKPALVPRPPG